MMIFFMLLFAKQERTVAGRDEPSFIQGMQISINSASTIVESEVKIILRYLINKKGLPSKDYPREYNS